MIQSAWKTGTVVVGGVAVTLAGVMEWLKHNEPAKAVMHHGVTTVIEKWPEITGRVREGVDEGLGLLSWPAPKAVRTDAEIAADFQRAVRRLH